MQCLACGQRRLFDAAALRALLRDGHLRLPPSSLLLCLLSDKAGAQARLAIPPVPGILT